MRNIGELRAVIFREDDHWVAQCLEFDIGVQAEDLDTLRTRLRMALMAEQDAREGTDENPFPGIEQSPQHFHEMWDKSAGELTPRQDTGGVRSDESPLRMALCA